MREHIPTLKFFFLFVLVAGYFTSGISQSYRTALGFRFGKNIMFSASQRIVKKTTIDLYHETALFSDKSFTALAGKRHFSLITKRLNVFLGAGPFHQFEWIESPKDVASTPYHTGGLVANAGLDFTIGRLNIGYDIMPVVHLVGEGSDRKFYTQSGITLRYVIVKQPSKIKKWFKRKR